MASTSAFKTFLLRLKSELGLDSILKSSRDTKLLGLQRFVRLFAYGASTLILALYLSSLGNSDARIGLFMTLTLLGDVVISFGLTMFADGLGRRRILAGGAVLMSTSGVIFAFSGNYWVLVAASIFGVISPRSELKIKTHFPTTLYIHPLRVEELIPRRSVGMRSVHSKLLKNPLLPSLLRLLVEVIYLHGTPY